MTDLSDLAREHVDRVRPHIRLAPVAEIVAAGRRRRHRSAALAAATVAIGVTAALLTVWPSHWSPPADRPIVLDHGGLTIEPVRGVTPAYDEAYARAAAAQVIQPEVDPATRIVLARVRSNLAPAPSGFDGTPVQTSWPLAWVLLSPERRPRLCLVELRPGTPAGPLGTAAVIVDATTGVASVYLPNHATCAGWIAPRLEPAEAEYSVPFAVDPHGRITVTLPPCGIPFGGEQGPVIVEDQIVPLAPGAVQYAAAVRIGPCDRPATSYQVKPPGPKAPFSHAPTGQMRRTPDGVVIDP